MKRSTDPRHQARILALQELFSEYFNVEDIPTEEITVSELMEINEMVDYNKDLYAKIVDGVSGNTRNIDEIIK